jgi:plastocyanin
MVRVALAIVLAALIIACDRNSVAPADQLLAPVGPSAAITTTEDVSTVGPHATQGRLNVFVNMQDACDPVTFNQRGIACARPGGVTFDQFIAGLTQLGFIGPWAFTPSTATVEPGQTFVATNRGGETHSFTQVADFGGGIVPLLNQLAHVPNVAPECGALQADDFVPPGGTYREEVNHAGNLKFQCCIHPWMRLEAVSGR